MSSCTSSFCNVNQISDLTSLHCTSCLALLWPAHNEPPLRHRAGGRAGGRVAERAGDFVIVTCIVKSAAAAAGLEVAVRARGRGGAKCVSYGGYIEEVIPAVRDILANRRHRRIVLYPLFVAVAVESAVERPAARLQLAWIDRCFFVIYEPSALPPSHSREGVQSKITLPS